MKIGRETNWYRPYAVSVNSKAYKIRKIHFYNTEGIVVSSNSGWLETKQSDIKEVELPIEELKLKRKVKFDGTVFIISKGREPYGYDTEADLYIPADMLNIHFVEHKIMYSTQIRAIYEGEQGIYIATYVKCLDEDLRSIRAEYEEVYKRVTDSDLSIKGDGVLADIDKLKELAEEFIAERKRIHSLTIGDIEI
jgi:hypothetical protein